VPFDAGVGSAANQNDITLLEGGEIGRAHV
jgi:hypothetical protein